MGMRRDLPSGAAAMLLGVLFVAGCAGPAGEDRRDQRFGAAAAPAAVPVATIYPFQRKAAFIADMAGELDGINCAFDRLLPLQHGADAASGIEAMRGLSASLYRRLDEAGSTPESGWPALTDGFRTDLAGLRGGLERVRRQVGG